MEKDSTVVADYTIYNPETVSKYKDASQISERVLAAVSELCVPGEKIVTICQKGDKLMEEELSKVWRGKKVSKGFAHPTTVSPSALITPYTPLLTDVSEANVVILPGEAIKVQLGAQIDGFPSIVCNTVFAKPAERMADDITGRDADLILALHYSNELLLRLMLPPGLLTAGTEAEKAAAAAAKTVSQARMTTLLERVTDAYGCKLVESTTSWLFERHEIEGKKKIILAPHEGPKGDGLPTLGEVWGVEVGVSLASGKVKQFPQRATLLRRTNQTYALKRPTSRKIFSEAQKKFYTFPFSLRQFEDERDAKMGVVECLRGNVFRQYEMVGDRDNAPVARLWTTVAITKNGIMKIGAPPPPDLSKIKSDKKIEDQEILDILATPLSTNQSKKKKPRKKKSGKKSGQAIDGKGKDEEEVDDEDNED